MHQKMTPKPQWAHQQGYLALGEAVHHHLPHPHRPLPRLTTRCQTVSGDPQPLVKPTQMLEILKEVQATMAGGAWRMMPWVLGPRVVETLAWGLSLVAGVALGEVKGVARALVAARAQTVRAVNQKVEIAEKSLQLYPQLSPEATWTRGFFQTPDGDRLP